MLEVLIQHLAGQCLKKQERRNRSKNWSCYWRHPFLITKIEKFGITELDTGDPLPNRVSTLMLFRRSRISGNISGGAEIYPGRC